MNRLPLKAMPTQVDCVYVQRILSRTPFSYMVARKQSIYIWRHWSRIDIYWPWVCHRSFCGNGSLVYYRKWFHHAAATNGNFGLRTIPGCGRCPLLQRQNSCLMGAGSRKVKHNCPATYEVGVIHAKLMTRAHSFRGKINSAANLVNSAAHCGKVDEIPRLTADAQLNYRGLIKSWINRSNTCYELMNPSLFIH